MDPDTRLFLETLNHNLVTRLETLEGIVRQQHTPASCELAERVRAIELQNAHQKGAMVVIGALAGMIASAVIAFLLRLR